MSSIDQSALANAKLQAARTGQPQPVKDTTGKIAYWVDRSGNATIPPDSTVGGAQSWYGNNGPTKSANPNAHSTDASGAVKMYSTAETKRQQQAALDKQKTDSADATKLNAANIDRGWVWVNGQQAQVVGIAADGTAIINYAGGGQRKVDPKTGKVTLDPTHPAGDTSVFGALNPPSNVSAGDIFTMSSGPADVWTGDTLGGDGYGGYGPRPGASAHNYGSGDHSASANTVADAQNRMTIGQGMEWFRNLSVQKPDLYAHIVDQLKATHYITPYTGDQVYGGFSTAAAEGMAKAMTDLAQVNKAPGAANLGLADFLDQKQQAAQQQAADLANRVTRNYQDPATLSYTAKQAAQAALGRALTPAEEKAFEASFRTKENTAYDAVDAANEKAAANNAMGDPGAGAQATAPDAAGEAQQYVQGGQFTGERQGYSALEYVKGLASFLTGGKVA